jgi:predicted metal-binding protein
MLSEKEITVEMEHLVKEGRDGGMDQAQIITTDTTDKVVVDDRVSYKCMFSCSGYNTNLQCPPFSMKPAETRELLQKYSTGIFYRKKGIPEHFCGLKADKSNQWAKISRELQQTMANLEGT